MKWLMRVAAASALAAAVSASACKKCGGDDAAPEGGVVSLAPVAAPDGLLCDIYVTSPNASWSKLQRGIGGAVGILPATLPGVVVAMSELDPQLATELDGTAPMYGAVAGDPANPGFAFAMKVNDLRRARSALVDGETARYASREASGMTVLVPKSRPDDQRFGVALTNNGFLVVARQNADLERLGSYVARTLSSRPLPADGAAVVEVPRSALGAALKPQLERRWQDAKAFLLTQDDRMRRERGRPAPDFGDPAAIVAAIDTVVARRIAVVGDLERLRATVEIGDENAVVTTTMKPLAGDGPAKKWIDGMSTGDAAPILALPATSALAIAMRDADADRVEQANEVEKAVTSSLGGRLKEGDAKRLHEVLADWTKARSDTLAIAVSLDEPSGSVLRAPLRDAAAGEKAVRGAIDLAQAEPFKELLRVKAVTSSSTEITGLGKASVATIAREPRRARDAHDAGPPARDAGAATKAIGDKTGETVGVAWIVDGTNLALWGGAEPAVALRLGARPEKKLADEAPVVRFAEAVGGAASTIVVAQPLRADPKRASLPTAPLGVAIGKKGSEAFVRIEAADGLLREVARWQMGF